MMDRALKEFNRAKGRIAGDFRNMISESEALLTAAATVSDEGFISARRKFEEKLEDAKHALADASQPLLDRTKETAAYADNYVRGNPWTSIGVAAGVGILIGLISARR